MRGPGARRSSACPPTVPRLHNVKDCMARFVRKGHQAAANAHVPLPLRDGVAPSYLWITETRPAGMLAFLHERFPDVGGPPWAERLARGDVVDAEGTRLDADSHVRQGMRIWYY